jgi:hypothetical protein
LLFHFDLGDRDDSKTVDLEHHRHRPGAIDGDQAVDQRCELDHADHCQIAAQVRPALLEVEDGESEQRAEHHVDAGDQDEQVSAPGHLTVDAGEPDAEHECGGGSGHGGRNEQVDTGSAGAAGKVELFQHRQDDVKVD